MSSIRGRGWASLIVASFIWRKSTQNLMDPSFFLTITTGEAQGLIEGRITPSRNISLTCCCSISLIIGFCRLKGCLIGRPVVWISCSTRYVLLMGSPYLEKTSWYSSKSCQSSSCCLGESDSGTGGSWPSVGACARWTEEMVPISHSGVKAISPSVRLSNWTATFEPLLRVGKPKSPSGNLSLGSNRVKLAIVFAKKKTLDFPAGITIFWPNLMISEVIFSGLGTASLDLPLIWTSSLLIISIPRMTSTSSRVGSTTIWHWSFTSSHSSSKTWVMPFNFTGTFPTPITNVSVCLKGPRCFFHWSYQPHLQQDGVAPVSIRATTLTLAIVTSAVTKGDDLSNKGATNVPFWLRFSFLPGYQLAA